MRNALLFFFVFLSGHVSGVELGVGVSALGGIGKGGAAALAY